MQGPAYLPTATEMSDTAYEGRPPVIDGLLQNGTYIFAGAPKVGKSFLMAQLAYHVATGQKLWDYEVRQGTVLYLALEDGYERLQERMYRMFGVEGTENIRFSVSAKLLGGGLDAQLERFMREYTDTKLIILDTLQKVREVSKDYSYSSDYELMNKLKQFADIHGVCVLAVHHTRKQSAEDCFETISGTTGLFGSADGALLMRKEHRTDLTANVDVAGRDQPDQRLHLKKDEDSLIWNLERAETQPWCKPQDPVLEAVEKFAKERGEREGSPSELVKAPGVDMAVNRLMRHLNVSAAHTG